MSAKQSRTLAETGSQSKSLAFCWHSVEIWHNPPTETISLVELKAPESLDRSVIVSDLKDERDECDANETSSDAVYFL